MHQIGRPLTKKNEKLVFIYLFLYPNWILFPFVRNIQFALRVHSAKRKIIIISLDCTNNLLFRFIDPVPSKRDCIHSTNENEYSAQMRRKPISRRSSSFILTLCCSFFCQLCKSILWSQSCYTYSATSDTLGRKKSIVFIIVRWTKHVPISTAAYMDMYVVLYYIYIDTCDHAFWG